MKIQCISTALFKGVTDLTQNQLVYDTLITDRSWLRVYENNLDIFLKSVSLRLIRYLCYSICMSVCFMDFLFLGTGYSFPVSKLGAGEGCVGSIQCRDGECTQVHKSSCVALGQRETLPLAYDVYENSSSFKKLE